MTKLNFEIEYGETYLTKGGRKAHIWGQDDYLTHSFMGTLLGTRPDETKENVFYNQDGEVFPKIGNRKLTSKEVRDLRIVSKI